MDLDTLRSYLARLMEGAPSPTAASETEVGDGALLAAFFLSGFAGLGYEVLWTRILGTALGSEVLAVFGVLAGYFVGVALGAFALQPLARRLRHPLLLFAVLETLAAAFAAFSPFFLHRMALAIPETFGGQAGPTPAAGLAQSLAIATVLLLPGTFAVGGTLTAVVEAHRRVRAAEPGGRSIGQLYGAHTFGAVAGTLLTIYLLLPESGFIGSALALAATGIVAVGLALGWGLLLARAGFVVSAGLRAAEPPGESEEGTSAAASRRGRIGLYALFFATGLVGVSFEVVTVQLVSRGLENTIFTFANILAVYLAGTAMGASLYARLARRAATHYRAVTLALLSAMALSVFSTALTLEAAPGLTEWLAPPAAAYGRHLLAELLVACATFLLPTAIMGALFSHILGALADRAAGFGYATNTLGAATAPFVVAIWTIPHLGYAGAFYLVAYAYVFLAATYTLIAYPRPLALGALIAAVLIAQTLVPGGFQDEPSASGRVLLRKEGLLGPLTVRESPASKERPSEPLLVRGRGHPIGADNSSDERYMGQLPLLLAHSRSSRHAGTGLDRALFLGLSTGAAPGVTLGYKVGHVEVVEVNPDVVAALPFFARANNHLYRARNVGILTADSRRFVAASKHHYDLIVALPGSPAQDGVAQLFALEHFRAVRQHMTPGGLFVQWVAIHQLAPTSLKLIIRTFLQAFPGDVHSFLGPPRPARAVLGLVAHRPGPGGEELHLGASKLAQLFVGAHSRYFRGPNELLGAYMLGREALTHFAGKGPVNSDLNPRLTFDAPRAAHALRAGLAHAALAALLPKRHAPPQSILRGTPEQLEVLRRSTAQRAKALTYYLQANISQLERRDEGPPTAAELDRLLGAFDAGPQLVPLRRQLLRLASKHPSIRERLLGHMAQRSGDDFEIVYAYYRALVRAGKTRQAQALQHRIERSTPPPLRKLKPEPHN